MRDNKLTSAFNSLIDHIQRYVCGQENGLNIASCVTYLHSRVIPFFLGTPWRYKFYAIDDLPEEHLCFFLFCSFVFDAEVRDACIHEDIIPLDELANIGWINSVAIQIRQHLVKPCL